ncbi:MAG: hypothetical protein E2P05_03680 [Acidobacteria bacterium]|nr:MAG: hypothetical protein E2P05_03680 [Acidobacteriota bacterium]
MRNNSERGKWVATVLTQAWRREPTPSQISAAELAGITPFLLKTGSGGLAWWRIQHTEVGTSSAGLKLKHAYISQVLGEELQEKEIVQAFAVLRSAGIEPLLAKGWAVTRLYPGPGLRSSTDIDLCVREQERLRAKERLSALVAQGCWLDLHTEFRPLDRTVEELYIHSQQVPLGEAEIRVLGPEDQLRLLCLHMLYHGVFRPVWLCDLGLALESLPSDFDWDYFFSGKHRNSDGVLCALGLAHQLLGARLPENSPSALKNRHLPNWLVPSVLEQWGKMEHYMYSLPMAFHLRHPKGLFKALRLRWPNPIQATARVGGPFNELPRLLFQVAECFQRTGKCLARGLSVSLHKYDDVC